MINLKKLTTEDLYNIVLSLSHASHSRLMSQEHSKGIWRYVLKHSGIELPSVIKNNKVEAKKKE